MCYWTASCDSTAERDESNGWPDVQNGRPGRNVGVECAGCGAHLRYEFRPDPS